MLVGVEVAVSVGVDVRVGAGVDVDVALGAEEAVAEGVKVGVSPATACADSVPSGETKGGLAAMSLKIEASKGKASTNNDARAMRASKLPRDDIGSYLNAN